MNANGALRRMLLTAALIPCFVMAGPAPVRGPQAGGPAAGQPAPDFELPRLVLAANGATAESGAKVRLSSFQGKRPVVLVLSSYT